MVVSDFDLPDLDGNRVTLSEWQGRNVLLIFFDPGCGFSREMLPALAALPPRGTRDGPIPLLVSRGDPELNHRLMQAHGVRCPVLLQEDHEVAALFAVAGSPMGYLIDERGRTATTLLVGPDALWSTSRGRAAPVDRETGAADGRRPGRAPRLFTAGSSGRLSWNRLAGWHASATSRLPRLDGGELSLSAYRGRSVLLLFWIRTAPRATASPPTSRRSIVDRRAWTSSWSVAATPLRIARRSRSLG